ncbi:fumarylacetoacetate hydrolase family protein [Paraburkholderia fungorum]|uniref:fumarylacetoacetate hydrolase family protein n=1 Tax=Paraburkholderia fungorum TaxID=134537 RepID=UPI00402BF2F2
MKLISYSKSGTQSYGALVHDGIVDLSSKYGNEARSLKLALEKFGVQRLVDDAAKAKADFPLEAVTLLAPVTEPEKIWGVGLNYRAHAEEAHMEIPKTPWLFNRLWSSLVSPGEPIERPKLSTIFDWEGELAVVIGRRGRHVSKEDALGYVAGYSVFMDGSLRDYQFEHCLAVGKNFNRSGSFGPWIISADEIPDPSKLQLQTRLNGRVMQDTSTNDFIFDIPTLISYISSFIEIAPGDVIATGTPAGVGFKRNPPIHLKAGDLLEVEVSKIGILNVPVIDEA